jgi:Cft2 family RNA processing exonuclease
MAELECFPLGIGQDGEGVCLDLKLGQHHLLLDCGLKDVSLLQTLAEHHTWAGVFCSHAHSDHSRSLGAVQTIAPDVPIFMTAVTSHLLSDSELSIYPLDWGETTEIAPNLWIKLLPAGHLPGAASIWISYSGDRNYNILYTGDFLISNSRLVQGLRLEEFRGGNLDVLIVEGSLGTNKLPHRRIQEHTLIDQINQAIAKGYSVLFPVPKLGIGQEILMLLRSHHDFTGKDIDIWIDRAIGSSCDLYTELLSFLPLSVQNFSQHQSLFWDTRISPRIRPLELMGQSPSSSTPAIIFVDRDTDWLEHPKFGIDAYQIFLPESDLNLKQELNTKNYSFTSYVLAEHCDVSGTTQLIHNLKPQHVVLMHGNANYLADLANLEELSNRYHIHYPAIATTLELPLGDTFHIPRSNSLTPYAGELSELNSGIMLTLPVEITNDPRWFGFADTGLISAKWQGEDLLIKAISQRELLNIVPTDQGISQTCQSCRFYSGRDGSRCLNRTSPLSGLKVSSDGFCFGFEGIPSEDRQ